MSIQLFKKLKSFKNRNDLSIASLCDLIGAHYTTYHHWKKAGKITGPYKKIVEELLKKYEDTTLAETKRTSKPLSSEIAVIGLACYYPGASNIQELWENILSRRVQFRRMLDQRLPLSKYYDPDPRAPEKTYLTKAAFIENYKFDWGKLRIPKKTFESTDIVHWLALDMALKTFENAGYKISEIPLQETGVIVGNTLTGEQTRSQSLRLRWPYVQGALNATLNHLGMGAEERGRISGEMEQIYKSAFYPITEDSLAGGLANTIAGRICNYLNLKGGGYIVDGACSSSLLAVCTAANALKMGDMDLALAGGVDISLDPFELVGFAKAGALARDKMSVYDQSANGFLPGEGCGFVLLKRLEDAIRDKNYVYSVIKGWGISSDGRGGIMEPSSSGQSFAIGRAYKNLEYKISDVDFVEGHGTGTTKGDRVELEGIEKAIEKNISNKNKAVRICGVTSFKSIVGHTKAAAGVGGFIKAILAVNQRILPPTASCIIPNDVFIDKAKHLYPLIQGKMLDQKEIVRAGISSAGFGGINCHVTIESKDAPNKELKPKIDERSLFVSSQQTEIFIFTSRTKLHLKKVIAKFKEDLRNISIAEMADLAALLNKKVKLSLPIKVSIVTDTPEHLYDALVLLEKEIASAQIEDGEIHRIKANDINTHISLSNGVKGARVGFLYPGQGSQRLNMTRSLVERFKWAQDLFELSRLPLYDHICKATDKFFTKEEQQKFEKILADTRVTQPAIILSSLIWSEFLSKLGIEPVSVAGHSLGELIAFYKAGAFNKETLIKFAELRGQLMAARGRMAGSMVSLFCPRQKAEGYVNKLSGNVILANINSPSQMIVSGGKREIDKVIELAQEDGISARRLNVSNAFHSSLMRPASERIQSSKILPDHFKPNGIKVYSGMNALPVEDKVNVREYFSRQVISQVNFVGLVESISKECDILVEVGPGRVLTDLVKAINKNQGPMCLPIESTAQNDRDLNIVMAELFIRNVPVKWDEFYKNRLLRIFVPASRKKFIENQCEHSLRLGNKILQSETSGISSTAASVIEQEEEIIPGGLPAPTKDKESIGNLLIELTHKITGFDKSSITFNLRVLDDLNMDSIKAGQLIGQAARVLGIGGKVDPSQISLNTLGQIRDKLFEIVEKYGVMGNGGETTEDILKRYNNRTWVKNFIQNLRPEEITTRNVNQLKSLKNIWIVSEKQEDELAESIKSGFINKKAKIKKVNYEDCNTKTSKIDCLIAILPRNLLYKELSRQYLKETINRLHNVLNLANSNNVKGDAFVVFVQFGGGTFGELCELKDIASSSAKSIASTLYLERPELRVRVVDFDSQIANKEIASRIYDELQTYDRFNAVGYDPKLMRKVISYEVSNPLDYKRRNIVWSAQDVVLVSGGAKGITAQCALEFARTTNAHLILLGRSSLSKNKDDEINNTLLQFKEENLRASYFQCDVTDEESVLKSVKEIEERYGNITAVIHGAGLNSIKRLKQVSTNEALNESLPKVLGAVNICKALAKNPPKLIVGLTSIIGLTGMEGSGWYGFANEVLNLYLHQFKAQNSKTEIMAIAYSIWGEVGMGAKMGSVERLAQKGISAIPVVEGIKHSKMLIELEPGRQQIIVSSRMAGIETWKSPRFKTADFRFIEKVEYIIPKVELIARTRLNVKDDFYLLDHNWKGSLLFPFVFGFEAMAQAAAYVLGLERFKQIKVRDVNLNRPISVAEEAGTMIEIHAEVLDREGYGNPERIQVEIYSEETAFQEPHFSAVFELHSETKESEEINHPFEKNSKEFIDLDMQSNIYGPILFQGEMFQCIQGVYELCYDEKTKKGECLSKLEYNKNTYEFLKKSKAFKRPFLIGDPFFIDSMLQTMQLIIPQDLSLPRMIEKIHIDVLNLHAQPEGIIVRSRIHKISNEQGIGNSEILNDGDPIIQVEGCDLKILQTILSRPTANDLVFPGLRDQRVIEERFDEISQELDFVPPVVKCFFDSRLENCPKEERHKIELPLINSTIEEVFRREGKEYKNILVEWDDSGRPIIKGSDSKGINISLSHDGGLLLIVAGWGEQGCDLETIVERSDDDWRAVLGDSKFNLMKGVDKEFCDCLGTSIWASSEVAAKLNKEFKSLGLTKLVHDKYYILKDDVGSIINIIIHCTKRKRVLSFFNKGEAKNPKTSLINKLGYKDDYFDFSVEYSGPQDQLVTVKKFPITFKANKLKSKRVNFSTVFDWIGDIREYSILPIYKELSETLETGEWGISTNNVHLDIKGEIKSGDIIESRFWLDNRVTPSVFDLCYDFLVIKSDGTKERFAFATQRISWVKILQHGIAKVEQGPQFFNDLMDKMLPNITEKKRIVDYEEGYRNFKLDEILINNKSDFTRKCLLELSFETSSEESNLVGNVYFSNYAKWMNIITDRFFYKNYPDLHKSREVYNELICTNSDIVFLNEAMPFDTITLQIYLSELYNNGFIFKYLFYKDGNKIKLAVGELKFLWLKRGMNGLPSQDKIPIDLIELFRSKLVKI